MPSELTEQQVKQIILRELPAIVQSDQEVREFILRLSREQFADKRETESRFDRLLDELRRDREEQANDREAQKLRWEENDRRWEEQTQENRSIMEAIQGVQKRHEQSIGALDARWGLSSEESFRNGLKGILESSFNVTVENYLDRDETGEVFGHPDQVELDVIVKNGLLILCELKSSMSKSDMYVFERKRRFYEKRHDRTATRALVISPMVDAKALPVAQQFGIEVYSSAFDLPPTVSEP